MAGIRRRGLFLTIVVVVLLVWLAELAVSLGVWLADSPELSAKWGQFGDAFGMVNSLFSGVALLGAIMALALQRSDMEDSANAQREAAQSQIHQSRVAALAAVLTSKEFIVEHVRRRLAEGASGVPIMKDRKYDLATIADEVSRDLLQVNELLDAELKQLIPEYNPEAIPWRHREAQRASS